MDWDKLARSFIIGTGVIIFLLGCLYLVVSPPTQVIDLSTRVEDFAGQAGVEVVRENSYENVFVENTGFGGAGGQGEGMARRESEQALVEMAKENNLTIHYTMVSSPTLLKKFYWVYNEGKDFYWQDCYNLPMGYGVAGASNSQAQLEKDWYEGVLMSVLMGLFGSACALVVVLVAGLLISLSRKSLRR